MYLHFYFQKDAQNSFVQQFGMFVVKGELIYSPFLTKSGHADNPATFAPYVKSMAANFISQNSQFSQGRLPYKFVRQIFVTLESVYGKYRVIARGESCVFSVWLWNFFWTILFKSLWLSFRNQNWTCGIDNAYGRTATVQYVCVYAIASYIHVLCSYVAVNFVVYTKSLLDLTTWVTNTLSYIWQAKPFTIPMHPTTCTM